MEWKAEQRLTWAEGDLKAAVSALESGKEKLYRADGTKFYGDEEHSERLGKLQEAFSEKIEKMVSGLEENASECEMEVLTNSYSDPVKDLTAEERSHLDGSRTFVAEDCEDLPLGELADRLRAVSAGTDKVAKVLHARYGAKRAQALNAEADSRARSGQSIGLEAAGELKALEEAVYVLGNQLKDPVAEKHRQTAQEAAKASRQLIKKVRAVQREADGTEERLAQAQREAAYAAF